jgi:tetratricopeptide (TPR) repeat protein
LEFLKKFKETFLTRGAGPVDAGRIVRFVAIGIFIVFFLPIIVSICSGENGSADASYYYTSAEQYYATQQYDSAYVNYKRAMQLDPENAGAIVGYGNVLSVRNERDSAILMFNRALEIDPEYKEATYGKALAFYEQKKYNEGIAILQPLIESNPDYYDAILLIGDCYYIQKKYDEAITWYENAYQNGGIRSRMLCHIMAYIYDTKGDYEKAIGLYQEALGYDSSIVDIYQRLGELIPGDDGNFYRTKAVQLK